MNDYVTLLGAEDVRNAGHAITSAAGQMQQAAGSIEASFHTFLMRMEGMVERFERAAEKLQPKEET